jgi:probable HAF family extracellular repeat protein
MACYSNDDCGEGYFCSWAQGTPESCFCSSNATWVCSPFGPIGGCTAIPKQPPLPTYTIIDLGTLGGPSANALSLNNRAEVVGQADDETGTRRAFLWTNGQMQNLHPPIPSTAWSSGDDINESGQVIIVDSTTSHFWSRGVFTHIQGLNPGGSARARSINNRGEVVGSSKVSTTQTHSFHWYNGIITDLTNVIGMSANDINDGGQITGAMSIDGEVHAALWDGIDRHNLGKLGGTYAFGWQVNNRREVVGGSERSPGGDRRFFGFYFCDEMIDLLAVTGHRAISFQYTMNNCGETVLLGDEAPGPDFFVYDPKAGLHPVRGISQPFSEWKFLVANKINDRGQIAGYGVLNGAYRACLMTPMRGDFDYDGDCDLTEFGRTQAAFTGELSQSNPGCERSDIDGDGDVDWGDLKILAELLAGPGAAPGTPLE